VPGPSLGSLELAPCGAHGRFGTRQFPFGLAESAALRLDVAHELVTTVGGGVELASCVSEGRVGR
jgi:hypothetical protein